MNERTRGGGASLRGRRVVTAGVAVVAVFASAACGSATSPARLDASFVDTVRSEGRQVPSGTAGEATLVSAARKICHRRDGHSTVQERRASRLTQQELATVARVFAQDARQFTTLALETYCPS